MFHHRQGLRFCDLLFSAWYPPSPGVPASWLRVRVCHWPIELRANPFPLTVQSALSPGTCPRVFPIPPSHLLVLLGKGSQTFRHTTSLFFFLATPNPCSIDIRPLAFVSSGPSLGRSRKEKKNYYEYGETARLPQPGSHEMGILRRSISFRVE